MSPFFTETDIPGAETFFFDPTILKHAFLLNIQRTQYFNSFVIHVENAASFSPFHINLVRPQ